MLKLPAMNLKARWVFAFVVLMGGWAGSVIYQPILIGPEGEALVMPTPTILPQNPAEVGWFQLGLSITQGAGFVLAAFVILAVYLWARKMTRGGS